MIRGVYRADRARLRHQLELSNWKLEADVLPDSFYSASAANAKPMAFAHPNPTPPPVAKLPVKAKPTKGK
jgi:hypothetical protein